ncbi:hypothetical protein [Bradyrhizobium sp.]|jgi:hypothetical protein|uniref:hypothetical protein n=1 Tax=Bradyrhizobium sp. TaxID=376 RepID=UPI003C170DD6
MPLSRSGRLYKSLGLIRLDGHIVNRETIALALILTFIAGKIERLLMPWRRQL